MKKNFILVGLVGLLVVAMLTFAGCNNNANDTANVNADANTNAGVNEDMNNPGNNPKEDTGSDTIKYEYTEGGIIQPKTAEAVIKDTATKVMTALKEKDFAALAGFVHPEKGVRFTPYTYVSVKDDLVFTKEELKGFLGIQKEYLWGYYDGTGDDIKLTPAQYYQRFIYSKDFLNAEQVGYNEVLSFGNMLENQFEVYPGAIIAEYYFSGFDPQYEGMDWQSLRIVFQQHEEAWYLVGIIHNQWTI